MPWLDPATLKKAARENIERGQARKVALIGLNDPEKVKKFIKFVKDLSQGRKKLH